MRAVVAAEEKRGRRQSATFRTKVSFEERRKEGKILTTESKKVGMVGGRSGGDDFVAARDGKRERGRRLVRGPKQKCRGWDERESSEL